MNIRIEGRGSVSAAGADPVSAHATWKLDRPTWTRDGATGLPVYRIDELPTHPAIEAFARKRRPDRTTLLALHAADQAVTEAGWHGRDFAVLVGCSRGPTATWERSFDHFREHGTTPMRTSPQTTLGGIGFALADYFGPQAIPSSFSVTCSSGFHALLHGVAMLRAGMVERVLVGGAEAPITPFTLRQMEALGIYATPPTGRKHACMPLAEPKTGMAIGEGAAFFALSLGAGPFRITGIGFGREQVGSATGITVEGQGLQAAMRGALAEAGIPHADVVLHAPGTRKGDAAEQLAIRRVMGEYEDVDGLFHKFVVGHTFGASGPLGLDFAVSVLAEASDFPSRSLLVNATGFGGNAVSVVVGGFPLERG